MNKRNLIIVGIIIILALGVGSFWYVSNIQTGKILNNNGEKLAKKNNEELIKVFKDDESISNSDKIDTSNWKTYRNNQIGFQISYPRKWKITINDYLHSSYSSFEFAITKKKKCGDSIYRCKEKIVGLEVSPPLINNHTTKNDKDKVLDFSNYFLDEVVRYYQDFGSQEWSGCQFEIKPIYSDNIVRFLFYPSDIRDKESLQIRKEILKSFKLIKKKK